MPDPQRSEVAAAVIVGAGSSRRMGFDKLFAPLAGKPVIAHSIRAFEQCAGIQEIILVTQAGEGIAKMKALVEAEGFQKVRQIVAGDSERYLSVWNGLQAVSAEADLVAIHDGARPLITPALIEACLRLAAENGSACCASPIPDTVKRASDELVVSESVDRTGLWSMQTPQVFRSALILQAYAALIARHEPVTDEVSAIQNLGKKIALLRNDDWNFKITFPHDLKMAAHVLELREK